MLCRNRSAVVRTAVIGVLALTAMNPKISLFAGSEKTKILHSELVLPPNEKQSYEACLFPLDRGRLALFFDVRGVLKMRVSEDRGRTWGEPTALRTAAGKEILGNRTSPVRLGSGAIGLFHTDRHHVLKGRDGPLRFRVSKDEGKSLSDGVFVNPIFAVQRNGTARVISKGRIVSPAFIWISSLPGGDSESEDNSTCYSWTYMSDDDGATWKTSDSQLLVRMNKGRDGYYSFEEPCVEELRDGRLIMLGRTELGRQFISYSKDRGASWSEPQPAPLASAYAPALLARVPKSNDLLTIWNQVSPKEILRGQHRHRLSSAISSDDGKTWKHFRNLESRDQTSHVEPPPIKVYRMEKYQYAEGPNRICYPSVAFMGDEAAICYDYGVLSKGKERHATKLVVVPIKWFYEK
jgi:sialidase-1